MSRRIFFDIEEALAREVRRITFHDDRTLSKTVLQDTFDPLTGEIIEAPIEADFYDSSADASNIQYPNFFIQLKKVIEDKTSGREVPNYGRYITHPTQQSPRAYEVVVSGSDGQINPAGNDLKTSIFNIRKVVPGLLLRLISGNSVGTYTVASVTPASSGPHTITVSNELVTGLPASAFATGTRELTFLAYKDLNAVKVGDNFVDSLAASFPITVVNVNENKITIGGVGTPSLLANSKITRTGNVFQTADLSLVRFMLLDPSKPVFKPIGNGCGPDQAPVAGEENVGVSPAIPLDAYYLIRIDSKERVSHIDIINRVWEEFNPPRTGLPVIIRNANSFEQLLTQDITSGGSSTVNVGDNSGFELGDRVYVFDNFRPSKDTTTEGFQQPFESQIVNKLGTTQVVLSNVVPDIYKFNNSARIVSNADFYVYMFHFVDHITKDIDGSQYWVHELTFLVQLWVDRLGDGVSSGVVRDIADPIEDLDGNVIIPDL